MKSFSVVLSSVLLLTAFSGCNHYSLINSPWHKNIAIGRLSPAELNTFVEEAEEAVKQLALADTIADWQPEYDKMTQLREKMSDESLDRAQLKECDAIMEQMEVGKLAVQLKKVDPKMGMQQCAVVAAEISKHIKSIRNHKAKA